MSRKPKQFQQERHKRQQLVDKLRSLTSEQLIALGIDPTLLDE